MIRSILVALDGSASSVAGAQLALELARHLGAYVEIRRPRCPPISLLTSETVLDLEPLERADNRVTEVLDSFRDDAGGAKMSFEAHMIDGDPVAQIGLEAVSHDVVVLGNQILFSADRELGTLPSCRNSIGGCASYLAILLGQSTIAPDETRPLANASHAAERFLGRRRLPQRAQRRRLRCPPCG